MRHDLVPSLVIEGRADGFLVFRIGRIRPLTFLGHVRLDGPPPEEGSGVHGIAREVSSPARRRTIPRAARRLRRIQTGDGRSHARPCPVHE
jgi:hypothetical protein